MALLRPNIQPHDRLKAAILKAGVGSHQELLRGESLGPQDLCWNAGMVPIGGPLGEPLEEAGFPSEDRGPLGRRRTRRG